MRNFPLIFIGLFILEYIISGTLGFFVIKKVVSNYGKKLCHIVCFLYLVYSILIPLIFTFLYFYPFKTTESTNYSLYFLFNVILVADLLIKNMLAFILILYFFFLLIRIRIDWLLYAGLIISLGFAGTIAFGGIVGRTQLGLNKIEVGFANLPESFNGLTIVQISDIHIGGFKQKKSLLEKVIKKINGLNPNIILLTGDLVNNFRNETFGWQPIFSKLNANVGKYAILGNHDYGDYYNWKSQNDKVENFSSVINAYHEFGFLLLRNESVKISNSKDSIYLIGVENWGHKPFPQYANLVLALENVPQGSFKILMTHDPSHWESKICGKQDIVLTLSGHTHGLQWGFKPGGIEFSLMYFLRKKWAGLYSNNEQYLYVNRGLGTIGVNFRLDMPAEITQITLRKK
jgi:uncharacterized protein